MTDEKHYFANDGSNWRSTASPVNANEARAADKALDDEAREGAGFSATNEARLSHTIVEDSASTNGPGDEPESEDDTES